MYDCSDCDFQSTTPSPVRLHISMEHSARVGEATVNPQPAGTNFTPFLPQFFPECKVGDYVKGQMQSYRRCRRRSENMSLAVDEETIACEV